jgi:hypothetical protein
MQGSCIYQQAALVTMLEQESFRCSKRCFFSQYDTAANRCLKKKCVDTSTHLIGHQFCLSVGAISSPDGFQSCEVVSLQLLAKSHAVHRFRIWHRFYPY